MAYQAGVIRLRGTVDDLTFLKRDGAWIVRRKSSLNKRKYKRRPCFANSRRSNDQFKLGMKIASRVYQAVYLNAQERVLFDYLGPRAVRLIKEGRTVEEIEDNLIRYIKIVGYPLMEWRLPERWRENPDCGMPESVAGHKNRESGDASGAGEILGRSFSVHHVPHVMDKQPDTLLHGLDLEHLETLHSGP